MADTNQTQAPTKPKPGDVVKVTPVTTPVKQVKDKKSVWREIGETFETPFVEVAHLVEAGIAKLEGIVSGGAKK